MKIHQAHDAVLKVALSNPRVAKDFLSHHLPKDIQSKIDLSSLRACSNNLISPELRELRTDVVLSVEWKEKDKRQGSFIYIHVEEEKNPPWLMAFKMIKYTVYLLDQLLQESQEKVLPIIIPVVVYTGKKSYPYSVDVFDLFGENKALAKEWMFKKFKLIDLSAIPDDELRTHHLSGVLEILMKHIHAADLMKKLEDFSLEFQYLADSALEKYVLAMIEYVLAKANLNDKEKFFKWIRENLTPEIHQASMTIADQLREEGMLKGMERGIQQGMEQGIQQGTLEGERTILKKQMAWRFSSIPDKYVGKINHATLEEIEVFAKKFLEAKSLEEIFENYH